MADKGLREYRDEDLAEALAEIEAESSEPVEPEQPKKALPERTLLVITKAHEELRAITLDQVLYALYPDDDDSLCLRCKYIISKIFQEAEEEVAKSKEQPSIPASPTKRPMLPSRREREEMKKKREEAKLTVLKYMDTCKPLEEDKGKNKKYIEEKTENNDTIKPCYVPCEKVNAPCSPKSTSGNKVEEEFITEQDDNDIPIMDDIIDEKQENKSNFFTRNLQRSALRKKKVLNTVTQSEC